MIWLQVEGRAAARRHHAQQATTLLEYMVHTYYCTPCKHYRITLVYIGARYRILSTKYSGAGYLYLSDFLQIALAPLIKTQENAITSSIEEAENNKEYLARHRSRVYIRIDYLLYNDADRTSAYARHRALEVSLSIHMYRAKAAGLSSSLKKTPHRVTCNSSREMTYSK